MHKNYFFYRVFRRLDAYFACMLNVLYFFVYALPWLKLNSVFTGFFSISFGYQSILVNSKNVFIKVAFSKKSTIKNEYSNYLSLINTLPYLTEILPSYRMLDGWFASALICERMTKVKSSEALSPAIFIQERLGRSAALDRRLSLIDCPQITAGLNSLAEEFGKSVADQLTIIAKNFLLSPNYELGAAHGDFHSRNIMKDIFGHPKIIDLDCVRLKAVREFDPLYFALEQVWSISNDDWVESLANCFDGFQDDVVSCLESFGVKWSGDLGTAFFLDRLGQDTINYNIVYSKHKLRRLVDAALEMK